MSKIHCRDMPNEQIKIRPLFYRGLAISLLLFAALVAAAAPAGQQSASSPQSQPPLRLSPADLEIYEHAETLIDWTPQQVHSVPSLRKLRLAESQDNLPGILTHVSETALATFRDFAKIDCDEQVYSETSLKNPLQSWGGMRRNSVVRNFRYIIVPRPQGEILAFDEYRTDRTGRAVDAASLAGLKMITSDFASNWLYFSPADQQDNRFRYFGTQTLQKRECYVVGFAQNPKSARSVTGFHVGGQTIVLLVQGLAWIDEQTFHIPRIETWLLAPRRDVELDGENSVVNYFPVQPLGLDRPLWVPHDVTVTILSQGSYVRNTHRYSNFRLFRAESVIKPVE